MLDVNWLATGLGRELTTDKLGRMIELSDGYSSTVSSFVANADKRW